MVVYVETGSRVVKNKKIRKTKIFLCLLFLLHGDCILVTERFSSDQPQRVVS